MESPAWGHTASRLVSGSQHRPVSPDLGSFRSTTFLSLSAHSLSLNRLWHDRGLREGSRQVKMTVKLYKEKIRTHLNPPRGGELPGPSVSLCNAISDHCYGVVVDIIPYCGVALTCIHLKGWIQDLSVCLKYLSS